MNHQALLEKFGNHPQVKSIQKYLESGELRLFLKGISGSSASAIAVNICKNYPDVYLFILPEKEKAAYFLNDMEQFFGESEKSLSRKKILFFPTAHKRPYEVEKTDNNNLLHRTEVLKRLQSGSKNLMIVSYPEALTEKVIIKSYLKKNTLTLKTGEKVSLDFVFDLLYEYKFEQVDFVVEPGQFAVRGGIVDVFSFSHDFPYRIEFFGDEVESIRSFDTTSQRSLEKHTKIQILPNIQDRAILEKRESFLNYLPEKAILWCQDIRFCAETIQTEFVKAEKAFEHFDGEIKQLKPIELFCNGNDFLGDLQQHRTVEIAPQTFFKEALEIQFNTSPQPSFNKNFELLLKHFEDNSSIGIQNLILSENPNQLERIRNIFDDLVANRNLDGKIIWNPMVLGLHEGFVENDLKLAVYTDHQIFERYQRFKLKESFTNKEALSLKELYALQAGDYVTHIDHGIGRFGGLEKIENNGKEQEAIRLHYQNGDLLYVSIHSLHRISKYTGKDGAEPKLSKLGSKAWENLKSKTKQRVKDIAAELISLYAKRKASQGFAFSPDTFLQTELEASFIYEDTPDQLKATKDVKKDMESENPMDRLICGDVGFGKTEVAIRAAFKAITDNKQVAVLVPTTILALQHYNTFKERLSEFPCTVDYVNRFKSSKQISETLKKLAEGKIDILIGTHRLISKDVKFKDLGLLIVDEEQKFGVGVKEKLKELKVNVDTLTLTATPIPRTLQFSLMGARDLSVINTPPPNRFPVQTELHPINEELIRDAINYEISRGGQVYVINNRIQNIYEVEKLISRLCPHVKICVGHGRMDGEELENTMIGFINKEYDVLIATTIIESGLDIPNANTMIIYDAQNFGLSDLHQLRGRVGRSNKKAFCYLLAPPMSVLTNEARKRLQAIEEFSALGSGFNISMRDLDIRGAGNILGAEQSGFISEIGFEMFQKIMDEALLELKETEFKDLYSQELAEQDPVPDCKIESDMELLIPDEYISNAGERLNLYKDLDNCNTEEELTIFIEEVIDRFGPIPTPLLDLIDTLRLRWKAKHIGFEKISLMKGGMIAWFIANQESAFYASSRFSSIIKALQFNPKLARMKENNNRLSLVFQNVAKVQDALYALEELEKLVLTY